MRALAAIDAELMALDRRAAVAVLNHAPDATLTRLYWERVELVRQWGRAKDLQDRPHTQTVSP